MSLATWRPAADRLLHPSAAAAATHAAPEAGHSSSAAAAAAAEGEPDSDSDGEEGSPHPGADSPPGSLWAARAEGSDGEPPPGAVGSRGGTAGAALPGGPTSVGLLPGGGPKPASGVFVLCATFCREVLA